MDDKRETIRLDVEVAGECLQGCASTEGGLTRDFTGWLGLIAALDTLITRARPKAAGAQANPAEDSTTAEPTGEKNRSHVSGGGAG